MTTSYTYGHRIVATIASIAMLVLGTPSALATDYDSNCEYVLHESEIEGNIIQAIEQASSQYADGFFEESLDMVDTLGIDI